MSFSFTNLRVAMFSLLLPSVLAAQDAFFDQHCFDCHDDLTTKGALDLTALSTDLSDPSTLAKWILIHDRVRDGEMPPQDEESSSDEDSARFIDELGSKLLAADAKNEVDRGKGLVRRMNRTEYEHALRDLLGLPLLQVKELLPEDGVKHGFDKVPMALDVSHVQMRKYLEAADKVLRQAIVRGAKAPPIQVLRGEARRGCRHGIGANGDRDSLRRPPFLTANWRQA